MIARYQDRFVRGVVDLGVIFVITYVILQLPQDNESVVLAVGLGCIGLFYLIMFIEEVFTHTFFND